MSRESMLNSLLPSPSPQARTPKRHASNAVVPIGDSANGKVMLRSPSAVVPLGVPAGEPWVESESPAGPDGDKEMGGGFFHAKTGSLRRSDAVVGKGGHGGDEDPDAAAREGIVAAKQKELYGIIAERHDPMAVKSPPFGMVHPLSPFMRRWDLISVWLLLFTALVTPFEVAFIADDPFSPMYFVNLVVNLAFFFDLCLNFCLMYYDPREQKMISDRRKVAKRYLRGFFLIDLVSVMPYDDITRMTGGSSNLKILRVVRIIRLAKLLRILRSARIFARFENNMVINYGVLKLTKFVVGTLFIAHWMACLWHLIKVIEDVDCNWVSEYYHGACVDPVGFRDEDPVSKSVFSRYITAIYLAVMTTSTVGYGDVTPQTDVERTYLVFAMLIGASVYAYVVGSICSVIASMNHRETEFQELMDSLNAFIREAEIQEDTAFRLRSFFRYRRQHGSRKSWHDLLDMMSPSIRWEVAHQLNGGWMSHVPFFAGLPSTVSIELSFAFQLETFPPEEQIISQTDESTKMFVIKQGVVMCKGVVKTSSSRPCFGEEMLWRTKPRCYRAVSLTFCDTFTLSEGDLARVLAEFPSVREVLRKFSVRKIVAEKVVESSRLCRDFSRYMAEFRRVHGPHHSPTLGESLEAITIAMDARVNATFSAKLLLIRVAEPEYYETVDSLAGVLQRVFRGHQARKHYRLRREASETGVPLALLDSRAVQRSMTQSLMTKSAKAAERARQEEAALEGGRDEVMTPPGNATPGGGRRTSSGSGGPGPGDEMMLKAMAQSARVGAGGGSSAGGLPARPKLSEELMELRDTLMESMHRILEETIRRELVRGRAGGETPRDATLLPAATAASAFKQSVKRKSAKKTKAKATQQ